MIGPRTQEAALLVEVLAELRAIRAFLEGFAATPQETAAPTVEPVVDRPRRRRRAEVEE